MKLRHRSILHGFALFDRPQAVLRTRILQVVLLIVTAAVFAQEPPRQHVEGSAAGTETCTVEGMVVDALTGRPLKSAVVVLTSMTGSLFSEMTDPQGQFTFTGIPPGHYGAIADRSGYLAQGYGLGGPVLELKSLARSAEKSTFASRRRRSCKAGLLTRQASRPPA